VIASLEAINPKHEILNAEKNKKRHFFLFSGLWNLVSSSVSNLEFKI